MYRILFVFYVLNFLIYDVNAASFDHLPKRKTALIFGVTGQDGAYLAELLLGKNYEVHGVVRRASTHNIARIENLVGQNTITLHYGDLTDQANIIDIVRKVKPDEIYNLGAQSHVRVSFDIPVYTAETAGLGTLRILEAIRILGLEKSTRFYQASTSELYGLIQETPQTEKTPFYPRSPYAVAKLFAYWTTVNYREAYGIYACNGILFNHESPLREESFVTRKITLGACRNKCGLQDVLYLGNLDSKRDWGYAKDYVEAMWLMLQQKEPSDFVIATEESHSVREFVELAYAELGIEIEWLGSGVNEYGIDKHSGKTIIKIDPKYYRPTEVDFLLGSTLKAKELLQWKSTTSLKELVKIMIAADMEVVKHGQAPLF